MRAGARTRARQFYFECWKSRQFWVDISFLKNASKKFEFTNFDFLQNREFLSKFNNFFSSESWESILFKFFNARAPARTCARQNHIFWKFFDFRIFSEFPTFKVKLARVCARAGTHMIKFEKYEHSAFTGKKIDKFGQKAKILQKNENAHEIRKNNRFSSGRAYLTLSFKGED